FDAGCAVVQESIVARLALGIFEAQAGLAVVVAVIAFDHDFAGAFGPDAVAIGGAIIAGQQAGFQTVAVDAGEAVVERPAMLDAKLGPVAQHQAVPLVAGEDAIGHDAGAFAGQHEAGADVAFVSSAAA